MKSRKNTLIIMSKDEVSKLTLHTLQKKIEASLEKALVKVTNVATDHRHLQGIYVVLDEINNILTDSIK